MMQVKYTLLLLPILLLMATGNVNAREILQLELHERVSLTGEQFSLADLVSSHSGYAEFWQAIRNEPIGSLAGKGQMQLQSGDILGLLGSRGYDWRMINMTGAPVVTIQPSAMSISSADIMEFIEQQMELELGSDVRILPKSGNAMPDQEFAAGPPTMRLRWPAEPGLCTPDALEFMLDGRTVRTIILLKHIEIAMQVVVTETGVERGALIQDGMVRLEENAIRPGRAVITDTSEVIGQQASRGLGPGSILTVDQLTRPWDVHRNQFVSLVMFSSGIRCSAEGQALADGRAGDRISVKRVQDGEKFIGIVSGNGTVVIK